MAGAPQQNESSLYMASLRGNLPEVRRLLAAGADVNERDPMTRDTPLEGAAGLNRLEVVRALLEAGADVNARSGWSKSTPLMIAATPSAVQGSYVGVMRALIQAGADVNARTPTGQTAMDLALGDRKFDAVRELVRAGVEMTDAQIAELPQNAKASVLAERAAAKRGPLLALRYHGPNPQGGRKTRRRRLHKKKVHRRRTTHRT